MSKFLSNKLADRQVVVTGAAGLLGKEHCRAILLHGGHPILLDINEVSLQSVLNELQDEFQQEVIGFVCDITDEAGLTDVLKRIEMTVGVVSGLVNNASVNPSVENSTSNFEHIEDITKLVWDREITVGLYGTFLCTKIIGGRLRDLGKTGSIVVISSDHGIIAPKQSLYSKGLGWDKDPVKPVTYSIVKHGQIGLSKYFATYWAGFGIRVNTLCPGGVANKQDDEFVERVIKEIPLGRMARRNEYHGALTYLLSDESSYMTGATMVVDGGRSVW